MNAKITKLALAMGAMTLAGGAIAASVHDTPTAHLTLTPACGGRPPSTI